MEKIYPSEPTSDNIDLDAVFSALADPTRRAILTKLMDGQSSVGELKKPFAISQPAISKHLKVLESAGLIERKIDEQRRPAKLKAETLAPALDWLTRFSRFWPDSFNQLDDLLVQLQSGEENHERNT